MASVSNVKGAILEELILYLLSNNGYRTIDNHVGDPTLESRRGMLCVRGRGEAHQVDAIADYLFSPPFSFPQRLLVEAKCEDRGRIGLEVIRNAVGVHKDVSEFFVPNHANKNLVRKRFHYLSAVFSANGFSGPAQNYAYAQDVFLLDLRAGPLSNAIQAINGIKADDISADLNISTLRKATRDYLRRHADNIEATLLSSENLDSLRPIVEQIGFATIGMIGNVFPIFLIPAVANVKQVLIKNPELTCTLQIENDQFIFAHQGNPILYFRLPETLFELCFKNGEFDQAAALNMKERFLNSLDVLISERSMCHRCRLILDPDWIQRIKNKTGGANEID